jgi:murein DD-endopeptidase MepM/ murein hydrolase activator NlpD
MNTLVNVLGSYGGVIVGGDVNVHYPRDVRDQYPFTPYLGFKGSDLYSTYQLLGKTLVTGDKGATLDWIFTRKPGPLRATRQAAYNLNSDHNLVLADFDMPRAGTAQARTMAADGITADSAAAVSALLSTENLARSQGDDSEADLSGEVLDPDGASVLDGNLTLDQVITLGSDAGLEGAGSAAKVTAPASRQAAARVVRDPPRRDGDWKMPMRPGTFTYTPTWHQARSSWSSSYHTGLDFAADSGTPIVALARGVVTSTGYDGAYGNKTVLTLEDGTEIWYAHQTSIYVSAGETVAPGDVIGSVGSTGNVTGPHLHLEVRPGGGDPVDPRAALIANGVTP